MTQIQDEQACGKTLLELDGECVLGCDKVKGHGGDCSAGLYSGPLPPRPQLTLEQIQAAAKGMGYAVVPVEPSEAMKQRGNGRIVMPRYIGTKEIAGDIYRAMVSAAQGEGE